jgi:hypothetical protein
VWTRMIPHGYMKGFTGIVDIGKFLFNYDRIIPNHT